MNIVKTERSIYLPGLKGYVFYVDEDKKGEECVIHDLFVQNEHRKRGMGTYLVKEALKDIFKAGYKKAFVVVEDKTLIPFYEKLGFVQTRYNEMHYFKKQSTGLFDRDGTEIFVGDTVIGNCYGQTYEEEVRINPEGGFFPFDTPNSEWYITIDIRTCKVKRGSL